MPERPTTKRPAFQWYPGDWRRDLGLRLCSIAARGLWMEMMNTMHDATPYGHLALNGRALTDAEAAESTGVPVKEYRKLVAELEANNVLSRTEAGIIYSRRMVRDEAVRNAKATGGAKGAEHGAKGMAYGDTGGRPSKKQKTPLDGGIPETPHDRGEQKPPPSVAVAVASSTALPPTPDGVVPLRPPQPPSADAFDFAAASLHPPPINALFQDGYARLCEVALPHQRACLNVLLNLWSFPDALLGEMIAIADGLHLVVGPKTGRKASVVDVMHAVTDFTIKLAGGTVKGMDPRLFRGFVRDVANRPEEPTSIEERQALQKLRDAVPAVVVEQARTQEEIEAARARREAAMAHFRAEFARNSQQESTEKSA